MKKEDEVIEYLRRYKKLKRTAKTAPDDEKEQIFSQMQEIENLIKNLQNPDPVGYEMLFRHFIQGETNSSIAIDLHYSESGVYRHCLMARRYLGKIY